MRLRSFELVPLVLASIAGCGPLPPCEEGLFRVADGACTAWTACTADQFESTAPSATSDRVCSPLTACTADQFEAAAPTATSDRSCSALTVCTGEQFETAAPTGTSDRGCTALTLCTEGQFASTAPTSTTDRACSPLTTCLPNEYEAQAPTATTDRDCAERLACTVARTAAAHFALDEAPATDGAAIARATGATGTLWTDDEGDHATTGAIGGAISFDGADDYVSAVGPEVGTGDFSVSVWFKPHSATTAGGVLSQGGYCYATGWLIDRNTVGGNSLRLETGFEGEANGTLEVTSDAIPDDGLWHHVAFSIARAPNTSRMYIDGVEVKSGTIGAADITNTSLVIGGISPETCGGLVPFKGGIDDVQIFLRAITASDVAALFAGAGESTCPP